MILIKNSNFFVFLLKIIQLRDKIKEKDGEAHGG
jgi:hypothetical protein